MLGWSLSDVLSQGLTEAKNVVQDVQKDTSSNPPQVNLPQYMNPSVAPSNATNTSANPISSFSKYLPELTIGAIALFFFMKKK